MMSDERRREPKLRAALTRFELTDPQLAQLGAVLELLATDDRAPTTVRAVEEAAHLHVADSLVGLEIGNLCTARKIADVGTGAGFPGLALAVARPTAAVRLVESQARKCEFVRRALAAARIENATVVCARAEQWAEGVGSNDVVVARALAPQPVVIEYAAPLLRDRGALVDWRGRRNEEEERASADAARTLGLARIEIRRVHPFEGATDRHLHVFVKERETPARFPRRPGIARKRPLGASDRRRR